MSVAIVALTLVQRRGARCVHTMASPSTNSN